MDIFAVMAVVIGGIVLVRWMSGIRPTERSMRNTRFVELTDMIELDKVFSSSHDEAKLVLLYDPWCPVSTLAFRQIVQLDREVAGIDVSRRRGLSREIERRTGITHESPQAIVIDGGVAVWDASHSSIDSRAIALVMGEITRDSISGPAETVHEPAH